MKLVDNTKLSAYFESAIRNFEKRTETTIAALRKREASKDKKVKETAAKLLKELCTKKFMILNLGLLDIYMLLGSV